MSADLADACPGPGIYPDLPDTVYHGWDRVSASRLKQLVAGYTEAHLRAGIDAPRESTPALAFGTAFHLAVLQPARFAEVLRVAPDVDRRTRVGKDRWARFELDYPPGAVILKTDEAETLRLMVEAVYGHPAARALMEMPGPREVSLAWDETVLCPGPALDDPPENVTLPCKARLDFWPQEFGAVVDLKTTTDARPHAINRDMVNLGYYVQGAFYLRAAEAAAIETGSDWPVTDRFLMIFVEKTPPYLVAVRNLIPEAILLGNQDVEKSLRRMAMAYRDGRWPGYSDEIEDVELPLWKLREAVE